MKPETKRQIRESVLYDMAPAQAGQVSLDDVGRVFRDRGEMEEVEKCLDELVKEGLAKKTELSGRSYYVFESIAREAVSTNERRLTELDKKQEFLRQKADQLDQLSREEDLAFVRLRPIWANGWERSEIEPAIVAEIQGYVSMFFDNHGELHRREIRRVQNQLQELGSEKERRLKWKEETFIAIPASR